MVPHSLQNSSATPLFAVPRGEASRVQPLPRQPKVRSPLRSLGFFGALSAECAEGIPALLSGGAGFARGVPAVPRELLGRALAPDPRCAPARPLPSWVSHGRTGRREESGLDPGHPTPGGAPHSLSGTRGRGRPGGLIRQHPSRKSWSPPWAAASPRAAWAPVRPSIRPSVPWCGNPGGQGRDRGGSVRDAPTSRPIEAAGGAAVSAQPKISGQVSLPAPQEGRGAARSGAEPTGRAAVFRHVG